MVVAGDIARITGMPEVTRQSFCRVLNAKAMARKVAAAEGKLNAFACERFYINKRLMLLLW